MSTELLERRFAAIGARLTVADGPWLGAPRIDVLLDAHREHFDLAFSGSGEPAEADVIDVAAADRHLLLLVRSGGEKSKFLCGHDERHWFVAAVPEAARGVTGVETAKSALQPPAVAQRAARIPLKRRFARRTPAFVRQGESSCRSRSCRFRTGSSSRTSRSHAPAARRTSCARPTGVAGPRCTSGPTG